MKSTVINHIPKMRLVIIREDFIELFKMIETAKDPCPDYACTSAILNVFEYWANYKLSHREQSKKYNEILEQGGQSPTQDESLWIYKTVDEMKESELLNIWGKNKVTNCMKWLELFDIIQSRNNPHHAWDRTLQYQLNIEQLNDFFSVLNDASISSKQSNISELNNIHHTEITTEINMSSTSDDDGINHSTRIENRAQEDTKPKDKPRKRDDVFDIIASEIFNISTGMITKSNGGRIAKCKKALQEIHDLNNTELTAGHLRYFIKWYSKSYQDQILPKAHNKLAEYYTEFYSWAKTQTSSSIQPIPAYDDLSWINELPKEDYYV